MRVRNLVNIEERYLDVLQNIESGIVATYRDCPRLSDYDIMRTLEALIDAYTAERIVRSPRKFNLSDSERLLMGSVRGICEWRLGRGRPIDYLPRGKGVTPEAMTIDEIILCLKRILKSVKRWNDRGGRQGYLEFVIQYVR
jgi:hypothetical protein